MKMKKTLVMGLTVLALLNNIPLAYAKDSVAKEVIVKNKVTLSAVPYMLDDQIMIPVRSFANSQDCKVKWDGKSKTDTITKNGELLYKVQINSDIATLNGKTYKLKNPVELKDGKIFVEAEFLNLMHQVSIEIDSSDISQYNYEFNKGNDGFDAVFSDYHYSEDGNYDIYGMKSDYKRIPVTDKESMGLYLASQNRSDDMFMGYVKKISGLTPNTEYSLDIQFELATGVEAGGMGIGGSPSSSVYVKCGAVATRPVSILDTETDIYRMNIDIGQQSQDGKDLHVVGNVSKPENSKITGFEYKTMKTATKVITDETGCAYIIIGTDSGYEGFTEYYIDNVSFTIE
jgi:hypothetical protein